MLNTGKAKFIGKGKFIIERSSKHCQVTNSLYVLIVATFEVRMLDFYVGMNKSALQGEKFSVVAKLITTQLAIMLLSLELKWSLVKVIKFNNVSYYHNICSVCLPLL